MATREVEAYLGLAAKRCDSCKGSPAVIFCGVDAAFLCGMCDARVHGANLLASRHGRVWLCDVCEQAPASVTCKADSATLCVTCDADIHAANPLARRHERLPVAPFYDPISAAIKPSAAAGFNCGDEEENEPPAAATWMISGPGPGPGFNLNPNPKMMEAPDLNSFFADVDPYLDLDYADGLVPVQGKPVVAGGGGIPPPPPQSVILAPDGVVEIDFALGKQSYSSYNGHSLSHSMSSEVGVVPDGGGSAMADVSNPYGRPPPNPAATMDREARVMRYREKRKNRKFEKTIRYASRKAYAETRPRIKGRFAKRVEMDSDVDRIYSSSATAVAAAAGMFVDNGYGLVPSF